jgi:DeoR family transcriptional regulator of aga operon
MSRQNRLNSILEMVISAGNIEVEEVAKILDVSAATIRRDFDTLAKKQLVTRTHGGAVATGGSLGLPLSYRLAKDDEVKQQIAKLAAEMVTRYQTIGINGGTTTTEVARAIVARPEFAPSLTDNLEPALTVVTNALNIAAELTVRSQIKIVVTGGVARPRSYELTGAYAEEVLKEVNIDIAFLGVEAIDPIIGASASHEDEARINRQMAERAAKIVVVTDSSKFSKRAFACIRPAKEIDVLITDSGIDPKIADQLRQLGVEIVIA